MKKKDKKLGIFLPGRLASERLPNKLILPLYDTNLWEIACKKLAEIKKAAPYIKVYTLINDEELVDIAFEHGVHVINRDPETCKVDGPMTYIFKDLEEIEDCTHLMFLNPCLAFLSKETIIANCNKFLDSDAESATSVKVYKNWLWPNKIEPFVECMTPIDKKVMSTKDIPDHYEAAHCFHIFNKDLFFETGNLLTDGVMKLEVPKEETIDVDDIHDYNYLKFLLRETYVFDLDNTLCDTHGTNYSGAIPIMDNIEKVNKLFDQGHTIIIDTGRGSGSGADYYDLTLDQLNKWGVRFHELHVGEKIPRTKYIGDEAYNALEFFSK